MNVADHALITTIHNQSVLLAQLLKCIAAQTLKPAQWIIVDDGSDHQNELQLQTLLDSFRVRQAEIEIGLIRLPQRMGLAHARNAALAQVRCERLSLLDPHCHYGAGFVERMQLLAKKYQPDMVILGYTLPGLLAAEPRQATIAQLATPLEPKLYLLRDPLSLIGPGELAVRLGNNICYRTAFLHGLRYDETLDCFEDIELWYRALRSGMARGPCRCMLESGDYLHLAQRPDVPPAKLPAPLQRQPPPKLTGLRASPDSYDQRMGEILLRRWLADMLHRIGGGCARLHFLWQQRRLLWHFLSWRHPLR